MNPSVLAGSSLILPTGVQIDFEYEISQALDFADVVVVRLSVPPGREMNRNVFGVDTETGRVVWQIEQRTHVYPDSPFTGLRRTDERVTLSNWDGLELLVDPRTGDIIDECYGK